MVKKIIIIAAFLFSTTMIYSQSHKTPVDIYLGSGATYGEYGAKVVVANLYFLGLGKFEDITWYSIGFRYPLLSLDHATVFSGNYNAPYLSIHYGTIAQVSKTDENYNLVTKGVSGVTILVGYFYNLSEKVKVDAALGYSYGKDVTFFEGTIFEAKVNPSTITYDLGISYRF